MAINRSIHKQKAKRYKNPRVELQFDQIAGLIPLEQLTGSLRTFIMSAPSFIEGCKIIMDNRRKEIEGIYPFPTNWKYRYYLRKLFTLDLFTFKPSSHKPIEPVSRPIEPVLRSLGDFTYLIYNKIAKAENWPKKVFLQYNSRPDGIHITTIPYPYKEREKRKVVAAMLRYFSLKELDPFYKYFPTKVRKERLVWHGNLMSLKELDQFVNRLRAREVEESNSYERLLKKEFIAEDLTPLVPLDDIKDYLYAYINQGRPKFPIDEKNIEIVEERWAARMIKYKECLWCEKKHYKRGKWCSGRCRKAFCVAKKEIKKLEEYDIMVELGKDEEVTFKGNMTLLSPRLQKKIQKKAFRERVKKVLKIIQRG